MPNVDQVTSTPGFQRYQAWDRFGKKITDSSTFAVAGTGSIRRISAVTAGFPYKKLVGTLPENTFTFIERYRSSVTGNEWGQSYSLSKPVGWYKSYQKDGVIRAWQVDVNPISIGSVRVSNLRQEVVARLREKMKDQPVNLAVLAGEGRETVAMLKDLSVRIGSLLLALRTGDTRKFLRSIDFGGSGRRGQIPRVDTATTGQAANLHLMYWYGIRPLVSDILGSALALEKGLREAKYEVVTARGELVDMTTSPSLDYPGAVVHWRSKVEISARVKFKVDNPVLATLTDLGLTNPLEVLWELTKLSFVVDWGIGIGNWLGQLDSSLGKRIESSSVTTFERSSGRLVVHESEFPVNVYNRRWRDFGAEEHIVTCKRDGFLPGSLPLALFPAVVPRLELFQALTGLSLIRQRM